VAKQSGAKLWWRNSNGEINMFSESPPSYRVVVEPALDKTGLAMPR
jgi:hypothetical protein